MSREDPGSIHRRGAIFMFRLLVLFTRDDGLGSLNVLKVRYIRYDIIRTLKGTV